MSAVPGTVLIVGSVNADLVVSVERRPAAGETVLGSGLAILPGGKGANQAVAAARLGARAELLARVGDDSFGAMLRAGLREQGVGTARLATVPGPSGVALITVGPDGDNAIIVAPGANAALTPVAVRGARDAFAAAAVVSAQLEVPLDAVEAAAALAGECGARFILNLSPARGVPAALLAAADPLVVNEHEAAVLLGGGGPGDEGGPPAGRARSRAAALLGRGPRSVVVTLGARGALAADASGQWHVPSPRVTVADTTGAGDAFTGALAWRLSLGDALPDAAALAARAGAAAVAGRGAQSSYPTAARLPG
jgi:ribokinase